MAPDSNDPSVPAAPESLVASSLAGDTRALDALLRAIEPAVFRLAVRMLGNLADAEDATQEILIKVITALASFAGRSAFTTWVYSVAANHLRDVAVKRAAGSHASLEAMAERLDAGLAATADVNIVDHAADPALALEAREMCLRCTQGMLMCLDVDHRLALVLTEVFDLDTATAAEVIGVSPDALRQRNSRGKRRMEEFLLGRCGVVDGAASCRCERQSLAKRRAGVPQPIEFARYRAPPPAANLHAAHDDLQVLQRYAQVLRNAPEWSAPEALHQRLRAVIAATPLLGGSAARQ